jgi:hypothetical protein
VINDYVDEQDRFQSVAPVPINVNDDDADFFRCYIVTIWNSLPQNSFYAPPRTHSAPSNMHLRTLV